MILSNVSKRGEPRRTSCGADAYQAICTISISLLATPAIRSVTPRVMYQERDASLAYALLCYAPLCAVVRHSMVIPCAGRDGVARVRCFRQLRGRVRQHPRDGGRLPPFHYSQHEIRDAVRKRVLDPNGSANGSATPEGHEAGARIDRLFAATGVQQRHSVVDFDHFYREPRSTGERMAEYVRCAYPLARGPSSSASPRHNRVTRMIPQYPSASPT